MDIPEVIVPEEATDRGPILKGELRSTETCIPNILAQFERITPKSKNPKVCFYPTVEQAKVLYHSRPPFTFYGSWSPQDGREEQWIAEEIWLKSPTSISYKEFHCLTFCSGKAAALHVRTTFEQRAMNSTVPETLPTAWFVTNKCFLLQILATNEKEFGQEADNKLQRPTYNFELRDGARLEIKRQVFSHRYGVVKEVVKTGYSIFVGGFKDENTMLSDVESFLILASFASRERSELWHRSTDHKAGISNRYWRFGMPKWASRPEGEEPLLSRDPAECSAFLKTALRSSLGSGNNHFLHSAVYALLDRDLTVENKIVRLVSGIQSALLFALPNQDPNKRLVIRDLYERFNKNRTLDLSDLWPLFDKSSGVSLTEIRNFVVHGSVITERDVMALSYAVENLQWILERILLVALGWDVANSQVSPRKLHLYTAYDWRAQQKSLKL